MRKIFKLQLLFFVFLFNCQQKKDDKCETYKEKVSFYMDKLTRLKQDIAYKNTKESKSILDDTSKIQDSTYYYYGELIKCDSLNITNINDFRSFLFLNNKREESIKYGKKCLQSKEINEYQKNQIRQSNFYTMLTTDSTKYRKEIKDYYIYSKGYPINQELLKSEDSDYTNMVINKIIAIYYFEGYDSAIKLLRENNFNYKLTDLWQSIEQFQPLDIYRRIYDFDKPEYYPIKDISKSKNYKEFYKTFVEYAEKKTR